MLFEVTENIVATTTITVEAANEDEAYAKADEIVANMDISQFMLGAKLEGSLQRI